MLSRRAFLRACMYVAPAALIVPEVARTFVLPPLEGWRPLTLEEIVMRAFRARADRIAGNIADSSPLLRHLLRNRARELVEISRGHMLDVARDEPEIARYLVAGTDIAPRFAAEPDSGLRSGYSRLAWVRTFDEPQRGLAPTIPMPDEFRVGGSLREDFDTVRTARGNFRDHLVSPDRWYELNAGHNG